MECVFGHLGGAAARFTCFGPSSGEGSSSKWKSAYLSLANVSVLRDHAAMRRDWSKLDASLYLAALEPTAEQREKAIHRISKKSGVSRGQIVRRWKYLGALVHEDAGPDAIASYRTRLLRSTEGSPQSMKIRFRLAKRLEYMEDERKREMNRPMSLKSAAEFLGISLPTLRLWIKYLGGMTPDENGNVTPKQVVDFWEGDLRWLLLAVRLGGA